MLARFRRFHLVRLTLLVCAACAILPFVLIGAERSDSPAATVQRAWQLAGASGSYRYTAAIAQTTYPAAAITSAGRAPTIDRIGLEGAIDTPNHAVELSLWSGADRSPAKAQSLRMIDGKAAQRLGLGAWQAVDVQAINGVAPGGNLC